MSTKNVSLIKKSFCFVCVVLAFFVFCVSLTSCKPIDSGEIMNALLPNVWVFAAHVFASVVLFTLTIWLVWKPTKDALEKRRNYIANEIKIAEEARRETYLRLKEAENEKVDAHNRANFIISNATNEAYKKKDEIESQANFNAKKIRSDAETDIEKMRIKIRSDAQKQIVDIAFAAAETLVKKNYRSTDDTKIINEFIKKINEDGKNA